MTDWIILILCILFAVVALFIFYEPRIEVVWVGEKKFRVYLWYKKNSKYTYKLIWSNE